MKTANWLALSNGMLVWYLSVCRTTEPNSNMDRPEADVWAGNFVQFETSKQPQLLTKSDLNIHWTMTTADWPKSDTL